jgi:hypothetical protein
MNEPRAAAIDDNANLDDLRDIERAVMEARHALIRAMAGLGRGERETFIFHLGFARGRLFRITSRLNGETVPPIERGDAP